MKTHFWRRGGLSARQRGPFLVLAALAVVVAVLWPGPVAAQGATSVDAIREQMDEGQALFLAGKYERAAETFEQGFRQFPYSAFLFNAGVCHQKAGNPTEALTNFRRYLAEDPNAPDAAEVRERIERLEQAVVDVAPVSGLGGAPSETDQTAGGQDSPPVEDAGGMKSLVVIETEPSGAPVLVYRREQEAARPFSAGAANPDWRLVRQGRAPLELTLDVGRYHIVVDEFRDFNRSETDIDVSPGHVHQFKANLSQGAFLGFLKVSSNVVGAYVFLDDEGPKRVAWGTAPHGELIAPGEHTIVVEAPGYEATKTTVEIQAGDQRDLEVNLVRLGFGVIRLDATAPTVSVRSGDLQLGTWSQGEPALEFSLPAGQREIVVSAKGYKDLRTVVDVPRGRILPVRAAMVERFPRGAAWTQAVIAASLIGAGVYFGLESDRLHENLLADQSSGALSSADPRIDQGFWYSVGADSGFALGGLFGILSVYNFVRDPYPDSELRRGKKLEFKRDQKFEAPEPSGGLAGPNEASLIYVADEDTTAAAREAVAGDKAAGNL